MHRSKSLTEERKSYVIAQILDIVGYSLCNTLYSGGGNSVSNIKESAKLLKVVQARKDDCHSQEMHSSKITVQSTQTDALPTV